MCHPEEGLSPTGNLLCRFVQLGRLHAVYSEVAMATVRKITVNVPAELLERAQRATGADITQTIIAGLQLVAARETYAALRRMRGELSLE
jgi:hypothetical protein